MPTSAAPLTTGRSRRRARNSFSSSSSSSVVGGTISSLGLICSSDIFSSISCGFGGGGFLSRFSPRGGAFVGDQNPAADLHGARSPSLAPHFEVHILRDAVQAAKFFDRHCERIRVRARRLAPILRTTISRHHRLTALSARHRCRLPETRWKTIWR